jgi:hypothetical protein
MDSNLITPPDILNNGLHSITLIDPEQDEVDTIIRYCQHSDQAYNIYVYTPNMDNVEWLAQAVNASDSILVNTRSDDYKDLWLLDKTYHYGTRIIVENPRKLADPVHYFAK